LRDSKAHNACLQLRRAISIQAEGKKFLKTMLSRRQLQGFVLSADIGNWLLDYL
jgi:hypothetical protein